MGPDSRVPAAEAPLPEAPSPWEAPTGPRPAIGELPVLLPTPPDPPLEPATEWHTPEGPLEAPLPRLRLIPPIVRDEDGYPCRDATRMENTEQLDGIMNAVLSLRGRFPEAFVAGDIFINYREGGRNQTVGPDVLVAFDTRHAKPGMRVSSYRAWREPAPAFVLEIISHSTARRDLNDKFRIYESIGAEEYWLHDPDGHLLPERVRGHRLGRDGWYARIEPASGTADRWSEALGLWLRDEGRVLRFIDPATGRPLPTPVEERAAREAAETRAETAEARAETAEARIAELEARLRERSE